MTYSCEEMAGGGSGRAGTSGDPVILQQTRNGQHFSVSGEQGQGSSVTPESSIRMRESSVVALAFPANEDSSSRITDDMLISVMWMLGLK